MKIVTMIQDILRASKFLILKILMIPSSRGFSRFSSQQSDKVNKLRWWTFNKQNFNGSN